MVTGAGINTIPQRAGRLNAQRALHLSSAIRASLCMGPACDRCRLWRRGVSNGRVMTQAALYPVRSDSSNPPTLGLAPMTPSGITDVLHACPGSGQVTQALSRTCHICRDRNHVGLYTPGPHFQASSLAPVSAGLRSLSVLLSLDNQGTQEPERMDSAGAGQHVPWRGARPLAKCPHPAGSLSSHAAGWLKDSRNLDATCFLPEPSVPLTPSRPQPEGGRPGRPPLPPPPGSVGTARIWGTIISFW